MFNFLNEHDCILQRGKFRPRLQQMVESNPEESASKKAFKCIPNLKKAIEELTVLKAVGPATASGKLFDYRSETLTKNV